MGLHRMAVSRQGSGAPTLTLTLQGEGTGSVAAATRATAAARSAAAIATAATAAAATTTTAPIAAPAGRQARRREARRQMRARLGLVIVAALRPGGRIGVTRLTKALPLARCVRCLTGRLASVSIGSALTTARLSTAASGACRLT